MRKLITTALVAMLMLAGCAGTVELEARSETPLPACKKAFTEIEGILNTVVGHMDLKEKSNAEQIAILDSLIDLLERSDYDVHKTKCLGENDE